MSSKSRKLSPPKKKPSAAVVQGNKAVSELNKRTGIRATQVTKTKERQQALNRSNFRSSIGQGTTKNSSARKMVARALRAYRNGGSARDVALAKSNARSYLNNEAKGSPQRKATAAFLKRNRAAGRNMSTSRVRTEAQRRASIANLKKGRASRMRKGK